MYNTIEVALKTKRAIIKETLLLDPHIVEYYKGKYIKIHRVIKEKGWRNYLILETSNGKFSSPRPLFLRMYQ